MDALAEFGKGIGSESGADALVSRAKGFASVLGKVVAAGRDAEVHAIAVAEDGVHAQASVAGMPLAGVFVVADAGNHFP